MSQELCDQRCLKRTLWEAWLLCGSLGHKKEVSLLRDNRQNSGKVPRLVLHCFTYKNKGVSLFHPRKSKVKQRPKGTSGRTERQVEVVSEETLEQLKRAFFAKFNPWAQTTEGLSIYWDRMVYDPAIDEISLAKKINMIGDILGYNEDARLWKMKMVLPPQVSLAVINYKSLQDIVDYLTRAKALGCQVTQQGVGTQMFPQTPTPNVKQGVPSQIVPPTQPQAILAPPQPTVPFMPMTATSVHNTGYNSLEELWLSQESVRRKGRAKRPVTSMDEDSLMPAELERIYRGVKNGQDRIHRDLTRQNERINLLTQTVNTMLSKEFDRPNYFEKQRYEKSPNCSDRREYNDKVEHRYWKPTPRHIARREECKPWFSRYPRGDQF